MANNNFETYYELCKAYYEEHGDLNVPGKYEVNGVKLGQWLINQRRRKDSYPSNKKKLLDEVGMQWITPKKWEYGYEMAKQYYKQYKNLNVSTGTVYKGYNLGKWVIDTRKKYKMGQLSEDRIELLNKINFNWNSVHESLFYKQYGICEQYYHEKGHLSPVIDEVYMDIPIGRYVARWRQMYKSGILSENRKVMLEAIGIQWDGFDAAWERYYKRCEEYILSGKKLMSYTIDDKGQFIGHWYNAQLIKLEDGKLNDEQKKNMLRLTQLNEKTMDVWMQRYVLLKEYISLTDDHEVSGKSMSQSHMEKYGALSRWLTIQRNRVKSGKLDKNKVRLLEEIGVTQIKN